MQKAPRLPEGEQTSEINEYYLRISKKLRNTKYLMLLLMVAALVFTLWAYRTRLTYDNFRYLLRDIDEAGHTSLTTDAVYYKASDTNTFLGFRGDLAIGSSEGIAFHRALGSRSFTDNVFFKSPILSGSEKYMLAYDAGGKNFYVYNSISRVYSETLPHAIIDAAAADNGSFAVLTKSDVGDSVVRIYNNDFALVGEVTRAGYAYSIGFLTNDLLYICECDLNNASLCTDISFYTLGASDVSKTERLQGLALDVEALGDKTAVIFDKGIAFLCENSSNNNYYSFGTANILYGDISNGMAAVLLDANEVGVGDSVFVCMADGSTFETIVETGARATVICGETVCVLYDGYLLVCKDGENKKIEIAEGAKTMLARDKNSVIVCYNDYAKVYEVK